MKPLGHAFFALVYLGMIFYFGFMAANIVGKNNDHTAGAIVIGLMGVQIGILMLLISKTFDAIYEWDEQRKKHG